MQDSGDLAWRMICELRKETREAQKTRTQLIGIKLAFVSAAFGVILGKSPERTHLLVFVPAFTAVCFDFLIVSYSVSIKRIGYYCRIYLEPKLRAHTTGWPLEDPFWEEAMSTKAMSQWFANFGNLGTTLVACSASAILTVAAGLTWIEGVGLLALVLCVALDIWISVGAQYTPRTKLSWPSLESGT